MAKRLYNRTLLQIFFTLFFVTCIMFVFNFIVFNNSVLTINEQISQNNRLIARSIIQEFDRCFEEINTKIYDLNSLSEEIYNKFDQGIDIPSTRKIISTAQSLFTQSYVEGFIIFFDDSRLVLTERGTEDFRITFEKKYKNSKYPPEFWSSFAAMKHPPIVIPSEVYTDVSQPGISYERKLLSVIGNTQTKVTRLNIIVFINEKELQAPLDYTKRFFAWLDLQNRDYSKEIFTTNYDLIIEKSLEGTKIPYFDGFVGSYEPFFWQDSIDRFVDKNDITKNWIRLWKLHGSLNWFWKENQTTGAYSIVRSGKNSEPKGDNNELVIYPSKDKYDSSRKQPFVAYFDRLKNYLINGELLFLFTGYSFSDQHINELIFNCLRTNNRLYAIVLFYKDEEVENLHKTSSSYLNLSVFGPTKAIINGQLGEWEFNKNDLKPGEKIDNFWDETTNRFLLGDFRKLVEFLILSSGKEDAIEVIANGK